MRKNSIEVELNRKSGIVNFNANIENRFQAKYMLHQAQETGYNFPFQENEGQLKVNIIIENGKPKLTEAIGRSRGEIRFLLQEAFHIQRRIDLVNTYKLHYQMNYLMLCNIIDKYRWSWPFKRFWILVKGKKYRPTKEIKKIADEILSRAFQGEY